MAAPAVPAEPKAAPATTAPAATRAARPVFLAHLRMVLLLFALVNRWFAARLAGERSRQGPDGPMPLEDGPWSRSPG
ncbi:hypothetical protein GCM10009546_59220 [Actinomadura livida]|uniref:Uncharacterized protein n=1 Tax=Actinomadura livida TaxID=79909 RepID=A0ABP3QHJ6_9ACTN|nr:hypothetical protein GCM10010208_61200 [Actinomadura livida]